LVATDMTRCIHCTRCVRFGTEVAGIPELGTVGRGEDVRIKTYLGHALSSELSGNMIDVCPVGALTAKPTRYQGRSWAFKNHASYAAHDAMMSHVYVHTQGDECGDHVQVKRVVPRACESVNQVWLSDRDRFSYLGLGHEDRLKVPMIRDGKQWKEVGWDVALSLVAEKIKQTVKTHGPESIGALVSPSVTLEEAFLCQKMLHGLDCFNMDYRQHQVDTLYMDNAEDDAVLTHFSMDDLASDAVMVLLGCQIREELPIAAMRVRQAVKNGLQVVSINPVTYTHHFSCVEEVTVCGDALLSFLGECVLSLAHFVDYTLSASWKKLLACVARSKRSDRVARKMLQGRGYFVFGMYAQSHPRASTVYRLAQMAVALTQMRLVQLQPGTNAFGLRAMGFGPSQRFGKMHSIMGQSAHEMYQSGKHLFLLHGVEPEYDCYDPALAMGALTEAQTVVAMTSFVSKAMLEYADILLPIASWTEFSGTWVSAAGEVCSLSAVKALAGQSKSAWKIYRVLGNLLKLKGFSYHDIAQLRRDIPLLSEGLTIEPTHLCADVIQPPASRSFEPVVDALHPLVRIGELPSYRSDPLVRRSQPLQYAFRQQTPEVIAVHSETCSAWHLVAGAKVWVLHGDLRLQAQLQVDDAVAIGGVRMLAGTDLACAFAGRQAFLRIEMEDAQ
jgi:NADH-quinone oxidoreductase subunit G